MAALWASQMERRLVPALPRLPALRGSSVSCVLQTPVPEGVQSDMEFPLGPGEARIPESSETSNYEGIATTTAGIGQNLLVGGLYGLLGSLIRPGIHKLARRAGPLAGAVKLAGEAGTFGCAIALVGVFKETTRWLGFFSCKDPNPRQYRSLRSRFAIWVWLSHR